MQIVGFHENAHFCFPFSEFLFLLFKVVGFKMAENGSVMSPEEKYKLITRNLQVQFCHNIYFENADEPYTNKVRSRALKLLILRS